MKHERLVRLVLAALFAALSCVATTLIHVPLPATSGYVNLGDGMVLLGGFLLGPLYGFAAGGLGSMLADLLLGYAAFAPGTFVIKGLSALIAARIARAGRGSFAALVAGGAAGECAMILGYFAYEALALGYGMAAAAAIAGNAVQGAAGVAVAAAAYRALHSVPAINEHSYI